MDTSWINEYEEHEEKYGKFYKEENETCEIKFIYLNEDNEIMFVTSEQIILEDNKLKNGDFLQLVERKREKYKERFRIFDILIYNITVDSDDLIRFKERALYKNYLKQKDIFEEITVEPTITMFQELNEVIVLLKRKASTFSSQNKTRKNRKNKIRRNKSEKF